MSELHKGAQTGGETEECESFLHKSTQVMFSQQRRTRLMLISLEKNRFPVFLQSSVFKNISQSD